MRYARVSAALTGLVVVLGVSGCGSGASGAVRAKVRQFATATQHHAYGTICRDVLAPTLLADFVRGGIGCEQAMAVGLGQVRDPHLVIGNVTVTGHSATVLTVSQASGEKTELSTLHLVQTPNGWRIASLGAPT